MAEQSLGQTGVVTPQTAAKIGQILGVEYMVIGAVNEYGTQESGAGAFGVGLKTHTANVALDVRVIDTTSAEIVAAATGKCSKSTRAVAIDNASIIPTTMVLGSPHFATSLIGKATRGAVNDASSQIVKALGGTWRGAIVKVGEDGTVTVNGGESAGLKPGDTLTVIRKGEEMKDPETGEVLGADESVVGELKVVEVKPKYANAQIVSGESFMVNDKVEIKE
jgi:hypothetical protein